MGSFLGGGSITDGGGGGGGMLMVMAKLMKQEQASDAEEEGLVPALSGRFTSMRKVPSLSDLSDPESSLGKFFPFLLFFVNFCFYSVFSLQIYSKSSRTYPTMTVRPISQALSIQTHSI